MRPSPDPLRDGPSAIERADIALALRIGRHRRHPAVRALALAAEAGDQPPLIALSAGLLLAGRVAGRPRLAEAGGRMLAAVLVASAIKTVGKYAVTRTRPHVLLDGGTYAARPGPGGEGPLQSFPSGHTAGAVAVARAAARVLPEAAGPACAAAALVAGAQVPRAAHYPSDVAAGLAIGLASEALVHRAWPALLRLLGGLRRASAGGAPSRRSGSRRSPPSPATRAGRASGRGAPAPPGS